jgi:site-specific DNA-cytosine methylase
LMDYRKPSILPLSNTKKAFLIYLQRTRKNLDYTITAPLIRMSDMNELSLFTGAGGGLLGTHLLGWKPCGYVEFNPYCQKVIAQRIKDGFLPIAPIFTDVREFIKSGAARQYRGIAQVVSAGFPCQPFSSAGKQLGADDPRK